MLLIDVSVGFVEECANEIEPSIGAEASQHADGVARIRGGARCGQ